MKGKARLYPGILAFPVKAPTLQAAFVRQGIEDHRMRRINYFKAGFVVLLALYGIMCAVDAGGARFLDGVNLIAHEAGHLLFGYFGEFIQVVGGTVGQLFVPVAFTVYFFMRRELYSSSVTLFWTGQNCFGISVYIKDAQAMALPLYSVGGDDPIHDWNYILGKLGLLRGDQAIGNTVYVLGVVIVIASVFWGLSVSRDRDEAASA